MFDRPEPVHLLVTGGQRIFQQCERAEVAALDRDLETAIVAASANIEVPRVGQHLGSISAVLLSGGQTQITPTIIEPVAVDVVNFHVGLRAEDVAVHQHVRAAFASLGTCACSADGRSCVAMGVYCPFLLCDRRDVSVIHQSYSVTQHDAGNPWPNASQVICWAGQTKGLALPVQAYLLCVPST